MWQGREVSHDGVGLSQVFRNSRHKQDSRIKYRLNRSFKCPYIISFQIDVADAYVSFTCISFPLSTAANECDPFNILLIINVTDICFLLFKAHSALLLARQRAGKVTRISTSELHWNLFQMWISRYVGITNKWKQIIKNAFAYIEYYLHMYKVVPWANPLMRALTFACILFGVWELVLESSAVCGSDNNSEFRDYIITTMMWRTQFKPLYIHSLYCDRWFPFGDIGVCKSR